jgi:CDGSH-type Zn-finger protein/uncharacterized Fe-S cluster protein YjdI
MSDKLRTYESDELRVTWSSARCIHYAACVRGLNAVFNPDAKPWIQPDKASVDAVLEAVSRCPTGALHAEVKQGKTPPETFDYNEMVVSQDGPLYCRGSLQLQMPDGMVVDTRMALCRCGASSHKPYCDGSHAKTGFEDSGSLSQNQLKLRDDAEKTLKIAPMKDGPFVMEGQVTLRDASGITTMTGGKAAFCRCGGSSTKPFCDGSHNKNGFSAEGV